MTSEPIPQRVFRTDTYEVVTNHTPGTVLTPTEDSCTVEESNYGAGNGEVQYYLPKNVVFHEGGVGLLAHRDYTAPEGYEYSSGMVRWRPEGGFAPGDTLEYDVYVSTTQDGVWPAIWASGWKYGWPATELDVFELIASRDKVKTAVHYESRRGHEQREVGASIDDNYYFGQVAYMESGGFQATMYAGTRNDPDDSESIFEHKILDAREYTHGTIHEDAWMAAIPEIKINLALGGRPGPVSRSISEGEMVDFHADVRLIKGGDYPSTTRSEWLVDTNAWTVEG